MLRFFLSNWLKPEYGNEEEVAKNPALTDKEKDILKALYRREKLGLAEEISKMDHEFVAEMYYGK